MNISLESRQTKAYFGSSLERGPFINFYHKSPIRIHTHNIMLSAGKNLFNIDDFRPTLASNLGQMKQIHATMIYMTVLMMQVNVKIEDRK